MRFAIEDSARMRLLRVYVDSAILRLVEAFAREMSEVIDVPFGELWAQEDVDVLLRDGFAGMGLDPERPLGEESYTLQEFRRAWPNQVDVLIEGIDEKVGAARFLVRAAWGGMRPRLRVRLMTAVDAAWAQLSAEHKQ